MADKQLWQVTPVAIDVKNDDGVIIGGQTAGTRYAPLTLIANFVHNLWAAFINAITPLKTSFANGDKFPVVNGSTATAMEASTLLELTAQNALGSIKSLSSTATEDDLLDTANYVAVDTNDGPKKLPSGDIAINRDAGVTDNGLVKAVQGSELIRGTITSNGWNDNLTQACTRSFIPVKKGDQIVFSAKNVTHVVRVRCVFYDTSKTFVSLADWSGFVTNGNAGNNITIQSDGYVKFIFNEYNGGTITTREQLDHFSNSAVIIRFGGASYNSCGVFEKVKKIVSEQPNVMLFTEDFLEVGYWDWTGAGSTKFGSDKRVRNPYGMAVKAGCVLFIKDASYLLDVAIYSNAGVKLYENITHKRSIVIPYDGLLYFTIRNTSNTAFNVSDVVNKVVLISKDENLKDVYESPVEDIMFGIYDGNGNITVRADRICAPRMLLANKGDVVVCNNRTLAMGVKEFEIGTDSAVTSESPYFTTLRSINTLNMGVYEVQHDNVYLRCWFYCIEGSMSADIGDYAGCIKIIRKSNYRDVRRTILNTPKSSRKARNIPTSLYTMQDGTFVGDKLWVSSDSYSEDPTTIKVINPASGTIEKSIEHDFGHVGISDYCEETDTMLTIPGDSDKIYLTPNVSEIGTTISKSGSVEIDVYTSLGIVGSDCCGCFGENKQTIYLCKGIQSGTGVLVNEIYKIWLEMVDGEYTGNATLVCTYKGIVNGIEGDFGTKQQVLVTQTCKYDGYIYLGYGTWGHNFFIIDLDDEDKTWNVVGRISYRYYNSAGSVFYLEPQFIALRGDKIVTGSRDFGTQNASILEFQRGS